MNSLADVLRQAQPLYSECQLLLSQLNDGESENGFDIADVGGPELVIDVDPLNPRPSAGPPRARKLRMWVVSRRVAYTPTGFR